MNALLLAAALSLPSGLALEKMYWDCDYMTTQTLVDAGGAATCSEVFEKLKAEKFKGDFSKFMEWWNKNKGAEHKARAK